MTQAPARSALDPGLGALLDRVAERQRLDFGHAVSDVKADGSLITACDRWSDATLVQGLAELFPREGVLSEEGEKRVPHSASYWVVDPLDGTTNFAAGIPYWAISLARFEGGRPVLAVLDVVLRGLSGSLSSTGLTKRFCAESQKAGTSKSVTVPSYRSLP